MTGYAEAPSGIASRPPGDVLVERQLWWQYCHHAVLHDPAWLSGQGSADLLELFCERVAGTAEQRECVIGAARAVYAIARVVAAEQDLSRSDLGQAADIWRRAGLWAPRPAGAGLTAGGALARFEGRLRNRLDDVITAMAASAPSPETAMVTLTALLLASPMPRGRIVRVPVVFGRPHGNVDERGAAGVLELTDFPPGPPGLFPDPRVMDVTRMNRAFASALQRAWNASRAERGQTRCVLWRIVLDEPLPSIEGDSLGAAFAIALRMLLSRPAAWRPSFASVPGFFMGTRPRTAVTGAIDEHGHLIGVGDMSAKFTAAHAKGWRIIVPEGNRRDLGDAVAPADVMFASTLDQAQRFTRRIRTGRFAAVAMASVLIAGGIYYAQAQSADANRQQAANRLAALAISLVDKHLDLAQLFAVDAYRLDPDAQTRAALLKTVTANPQLVRYFQADGQVTALAATARAGFVLAGTRLGDVQRWTVSAGTPSTILHFPAPVLKISADDDGTVVAATDGKTTQMWTATGAHRLEPPAGQHINTIGVSPSGRYVVMSTAAPAFDSPPWLSVLDLQTDRTATALDKNPNTPQHVGIPDDQSIVTFDDAYGSWQRTSLPALTPMAHGNALFGVHNSASAMSTDGQYFSYSNAGPSLPIWTTTASSSDDQRPALYAQTVGNAPNALAVSDDGTRTALADAGTIYLSSTAPAFATAQAPRALTGLGTVNANQLAFVGGGNSELLAGSANLIALWDLNQYSRITSTSPAVVPADCDSCPGPSLAVQPGGRLVAIVDGNEVSLTVHDIDTAIGAATLQDASVFSVEFGPPLWSPDGSHIISINPGDDSAQIITPGPVLPVIATWPTPPWTTNVQDPISTAVFTPDARHVIEVYGSGTVRERDATTGALVSNVPGPADMTQSPNGARYLRQWEAAIDPTGNYAAYVDTDHTSVNIVALATRTTQVLTAEPANGVAFLGSNLLIQRTNGTVEIWDAHGTRPNRTLQGTLDDSAGVLTNGTSQIAEPESNGTVTVIDYPSGTALGTLTLPQGWKPAATGYAYSPDGKHLITATEPYGGDSDIGTLLDWRLDPAEWTNTACTTAGHDLTPADWQQYAQTTGPENPGCPS